MNWTSDRTSHAAVKKELWLKRHTARRDKDTERPAH